MNHSGIIPAVKTHKKLELFLKSDNDYGVLMDFQISQLPPLIKDIKKANKKVLVHLDLIKGISSDEYGAIYLIQELKVDGIITIKPNVVKLCKKRQVIGIMRLFLKDRHSFEQSMALVERTQPDLVEVLPYMPSILPELNQRLNVPFLMGGLIETESQVKSSIQGGAIAITTSKDDLWFKTFNVQSNNKNEVF
jgi:glycerol uptake operon antiterminator